MAICVSSSICTDDYHLQLFSYKYTHTRTYANLILSINPSQYIRFVLSSIICHFQRECSHCSLVHEPLIVFVLIGIRQPKCTRAFQMNRAPRAPSSGFHIIHAYQPDTITHRSESSCAVGRPATSNAHDSTTSSSTTETTTPLIQIHQHPPPSHLP